MAEAEDKSIQNYLLKLDAPQALAWIRNHLLVQPAAKTFNWRGFAEVAAFRAHRESDLEWGRLAILSYEQLADESAASSATHLRAALIQKFGAVVGDDVLDPKVIVRWFLDNANVAYEEAAHVATSKIWKALSTEDVRTLNAGGFLAILYKTTAIKVDRQYLLKLRRIKNGSAIIETLIDRGLLEPSKELADWIAIRQALP